MAILALCATFFSAKVNGLIPHLFLFLFLSRIFLFLKGRKGKGGWVFDHLRRAAKGKERGGERRGVLNTNQLGRYIPPPGSKGRKWIEEASSKWPNYFFRKIRWGRISGKWQIRNIFLSSNLIFFPRNSGGRERFSEFGPLPNVKVTHQGEINISFRSFSFLAMQVRCTGTSPVIEKLKKSQSLDDKQQDNSPSKLSGLHNFKRRKKVAKLWRDIISKLPHPPPKSTFSQLPLFYLIKTAATF